jgi:hypothetical protein
MISSGSFSRGQKQMSVDYGIIELGYASGYLSPIYGASLDYAGKPLRLWRSGGCLLKRTISGTQYHDAIGSYPLLCCMEWSELADDLLDEDEGLVTITAVADPFGNHGGMTGLRKAFPDLVRPFKDHYVVDLEQSRDDFVSPQHRRYARRALEVLRVEEVSEPPAFLADWTHLYSVLTERHGIADIAKFSRDAFKKQLTIPGLTMLRASHGHETVGMTLWYKQGDRAYYHLGAYNEMGYACRASYAIFWTALELFARRGVRSLALGASSGLKDERDGLSQFKRGWATGTRTVYLCGRICNHKVNAELVKKCCPEGSDFFPGYRCYDRDTPLASDGLLS